MKHHPLLALLSVILLAGCNGSSNIKGDAEASPESAVSLQSSTANSTTSTVSADNTDSASSTDSVAIQTIVQKVPSPGPVPEGMAWIPPGRFAMGSDNPEFPDARPVHTVEVDGFWMDRHEVTNAEFSRFVRSTGYVTIAERKPDAKDFPGVPADKLVAGSIVFMPPEQSVQLDNYTQWWQYVPGASWKHPEGSRSSIKGRENHPVVHIAYEDAVAYCKWADKQLPTEAQWEYAARGGLTQQDYVWGDDFQPQGKFMANTFQGSFPNRNTKADKWAHTAPVGSFAPNRFGLYDTAGNVWEWCADWYRPDYYATSPGRNPQGPTDSYDPAEMGIPKRVQRGGSFLCSDQYCTRYKPGGRGKGAIDSGASHTGFRCVRLPKNARKKV